MSGSVRVLVVYDNLAVMGIYVEVFTMPHCDIVRRASHLQKYTASILYRMSYQMSYMLSSLKHALSPRGAWLNLRYYWYCRERSNIVFASAFILLLMLLGLLIYRTITNQYEARELRCLTLNVYHEARGEPDLGKYAVASVTLNRVASKHYPSNVCDVVFQKRWDYLRKRYVSAFSWTELVAPVSTNSQAWQKAARIAEDVYHNPEARKLQGALFYHARNIRPSWARHKIRVATIGRHVFYN